MSVAEIRIPLDAVLGLDAEERRREPREKILRGVEYCRFPRICADQRPRLAFTRDLSDSGLCLHVEQPEPEGALLRVVIRGVDGEPVKEAIARTVWSRPADDGGHWMGLFLEADRRSPIRIRYTRSGA